MTKIILVIALNAQTKGLPEYTKMMQDLDLKLLSTDIADYVP